MSKEKQSDTAPTDPESTNEASSNPLEPMEKEIDLNLLFPDSETDLNVLFPDEDIKLLLKSVTKNKKDLHSLKERFIQENETQENETADDFSEGSENQEAK